MQLAIWTNGPSFPNDRPDATESARPTDFVNKTRPPRYPWMTKPGIEGQSLYILEGCDSHVPERIVLISGIPLPAAYYEANEM